MDFIDELDRSLMSIANRYRTLLIPLSGGVDSRLIAVRCYKLGIPFEVITFELYSLPGDDFDIAKRVAQALGVRHHYWKHNTDNCLANFHKLILSSGGMNSTFTSYPDAMKGFAEIAQHFDCVLRGDQNFGWMATSTNIPQAAETLNIKLSDTLEWICKQDQEFPEQIKDIFENFSGCDLSEEGLTADFWKQRFRRTTTLPRFILPIAQQQAQYKTIAFPFLTRRFLAKITQTDHQYRDDKKIARQALQDCSPENVLEIPFQTGPIGDLGEPLLIFSEKILYEMGKTLITLSSTHSLIDSKYIVDDFRKSISTCDVQEWISKRILPKNKEKNYLRPSHKVGIHLIFKRLYAIKIFLSALELENL